MQSIYGKILLILAATAVLWLGMRFLLPILLPFLLAAILALTAEKSVHWMHTRLHLPRGLASALGVTGVFVLLAALLVLVMGSLTRQIPRLMDFLPQLEEAMRSGRELLKTWLLGLAGHFPGTIGTLFVNLTEGLFSQGSQMLEPIVQRMPQMATGLMGKMSSGLFGTVTGLIASFMLSVRLPKLRQWLKKSVPLRWQDQYAAATAGLKRAVGGWLLAQLKLATVTFFVLSVGFVVLRVRHSLLWAFLVTLVDAFPILGVGTVLLPWGFIALLQGNTPLGLGILAIYAITWVLRSTLEPKLVGKSLGLDPLVTLLAIYAGFKLWGILGMLLAPMLAMLVVQVWKAVNPRKIQR